MTFPKARGREGTAHADASDNRVLRPRGSALMLRAMPEFIGLPIWVWFSAAPLVAVMTGLTYATAPQLRPHAALRGVLLVSVGLVAAEFVAVLVLFGLLLMAGASLQEM